MIRITLIIIFSLIIGSCKTSKKESSNDKFQKRILGNVIGLNRLELTASFDECGEWGGHYEKIDIYRKNKTLYAEYTKDTVNCEKLYAISRKISKKEILKLNETHEKAISEYLKSMLEIGLKMDFPCHSGTHYKANMSDSSLTLEYRCARNNWTEYENLKVKLNE